MHVSITLNTYNSFIIILTGFVQAVFLANLIMDGEEDGLMDNHLVCFTSRRSTYFQEIGPTPPKGKDFAHLFTTVYSHHQAEVCQCLLPFISLLDCFPVSLKMNGVKFRVAYEKFVFINNS